MKEIWTHAPKDIHSSIINNSPKMRQLKSTDKSITIYWFSGILNSNINEQISSTHNHPNEPHKHSVERCQAQKMHNVWSQTNSENGNNMIRLFPNHVWSFPDIVWLGGETIRKSKQVDKDFLLDQTTDRLLWASSWLGLYLGLWNHRLSAWSLTLKVLNSNIVSSSSTLPPWGDPRLP